MANLHDKEQFPINVFGPKGMHSIVGMHTIVFEGVTGLVGTSFGIPGVTATRVATGAYRVNYDSVIMTSGTPGVVIMPGVNAPTGNFYNVNINSVQSVTGVAHIELTRPFVPVSGGATNIIQPVNPTSGTRLHLQFFVSPITPF